MKIVWIFLFLGIGFTQALFSQSTDIARLEYTYIPFSNGDNTLNRFRALMQLPIPLNEDKDRLFVIGAEYRYLDLQFQEELPFDTSNLESVQRISGYVGFAMQFNNHWIFGAEIGARINSNLQGAIQSDDVIYSGAAYLIKEGVGSEETKPSRLILGLRYSTTPGRNFPLPVINYFKQINKRMTYTLGVPKTNFRYYLNDSQKDAVQVYATLDNFFANIQQNIAIPGTSALAENISMTNVLLGLGYEHFFTKHLLYYAYLAYTVHSEYRLRDNNRETAFVISNENTLYVRSGVKFKF